MNDHRAQAKDLCMADAMPFQQHWEYRTTLPLDELLHDKFFLPLRGMLRAGDQITLCRFDSSEWKRLTEIAEVRVIASGHGAELVELAKMTKFGVRKIKGSEAEKAEKPESKAA